MNTFRPELWVRVPITELQAPKQNGPHMVYMDRWWAVDADGSAIFYKSTRYPQCNPNRSVVEHLTKSLPGATARQIPLVMVPFKISDYE
ncbi:hypothetical protein [Caldimonas sp. KR1-144]|uniref:hypothetical protein n=1 Tax=Caldimonas sp. KR1-144 TaxID=3400911 RepID=UPI003C07A515